MTSVFTNKAAQPVFSDEDGSTTCVDSDAHESFKQQQRRPDMDDSHVQKTLAREKPLPPITWSTALENIQWISFLALTLVPILTIYGSLTTTLRWQTAVWSVAYYFFTGLGITAGYHRLWAHRCYNASLPLQYFLALGGSGAVEGSIKWWSRGHRAHHRYTDTPKDPYAVAEGFWHAHVGWMLFKPRTKQGHADVSDLSNNPICRWQQKFYVPLILIMGFIVPTMVAGVMWGDWRGGFFYAAVGRLLFVHHSTFCVNSVAHWLGDAPFDDKHSPRDHIITAFLTLGEGYHNFHHQFPSDYRNALKWFQYDPTRRFIEFCALFGLAYQLKTFPENEVQMGMYTMKLKQLEKQKKNIRWPKTAKDLPVISWDQFQKEHKSSGRMLIAIGGFIHDVTDFMDEHPGGYGIVRHRIGRDASPAFYGGVYEHSNAANNLLASMRVAVLDQGMEVIARKAVPGMRVYDGPAASQYAGKTDEELPEHMFSMEAED